MLWQKELPRSVLRVVEVLEADDQGISGWYYVHGGRAAKGEYNHEMPMSQRRLIPEWCNNRTGKVERKPSPAVMKHCRKICDEFSPENAELVASGWSLESGGKIPSVVVAKCDAWLRAQRREEPRVVLALSDPSEAEKAAASKFL